jgi:hypothetical protein
MTLWKNNWPETRQHLLDWWDRKGIVLGAWGPAPLHGARPWADAADPGEPASIEAKWTDASWRARHQHHRMANGTFPADIVPATDTCIGPGSLALYLGSEPTLHPWTVWFNPCIGDDDLDKPIRFDPENHWWRTHEAILREQVRLSEGHYYVGMPDIVENFDVLASLRDAQTLMMDVALRPEWVKAKIEEINEAFFQVYNRIYDIVKFPDGSSDFWAFGVWSPGKGAKIQCDACPMISPKQFRDLVVPALTRQCEWLDNSIYHLDGPQAILHLDALLEIDALDAIEWTPGDGHPGAADPCWYEMYRRILAAGKSLQVVDIDLDQVGQFIDTIGNQGLYFLPNGWDDPAKIERGMRAVEERR